MIARAEAHKIYIPRYGAHRMTPQALDPNGYGNGLTGNILPLIGTALVGLYAWATRRGRDDLRITTLERDQKATSEEIKSMATEQKETNALLHEMVGKLSIIAERQEK